MEPAAASRDVANSTDDHVAGGIGEKSFLKLKPLVTVGNAAADPGDRK